MIWIAIGVIITFNVVFNHIMAMIIKPGGPTDLAVSQQTCQLKLECRKTQKLLQRTKDKERDQAGIKAGLVRGGIV